MKLLIYGITLFISFSTYASSIENSTYCQFRGQETIDIQKARMVMQRNKGEINDDLFLFFEKSIAQIQVNHDYLCKGIRISNEEKLSYKEKQLNLIKKGLESGTLDEELAHFFIENLNNM